MASNYPRGQNPRSVVEEVAREKLRRQVEDSTLLPIAANSRLRHGVGAGFSAVGTAVDAATRPYRNYAGSVLGAVADHSLLDEGLGLAGRALDTIEGGYPRGAFGMMAALAQEDPVMGALLNAAAFTNPIVRGAIDGVRVQPGSLERIRKAGQQGGFRAALSEADLSYHESQEIIPGTKFAIESPFAPSSYVGMGLGKPLQTAGRALAARPGASLLERGAGKTIGGLGTADVKLQAGLDRSFDWFKHELPELTAKTGIPFLQFSKKSDALEAANEWGTVVEYLRRDHQQATDVAMRGGDDTPPLPYAAERPSPETPPPGGGGATPPPGGGVSDDLRTRGTAQSGEEAAQAFADVQDAAGATTPASKPAARSADPEIAAMRQEIDELRKMVSGQQDAPTPPAEKAPIEAEGRMAVDEGTARVDAKRQLQQSTHHVEGAPPNVVKSTFESQADTNIDSSVSVVELDALTASHNKAGERNPDFPHAEGYQPHDRADFANQADVEKQGRLLKPAWVLATDGVERGQPMAIQMGDKLVVIQGNGRTLYMREARDNHPDAWREYQQEMSQYAEEFGISGDDLAEFENPVLVRVLPEDTSDDVLHMVAGMGNVRAGREMDVDDLAKTLTNQGYVEPFVRRFKINASQSLSENINAAGNKEALTEMMEGLPVTLRKNYVTDEGTLKPQGELLMERVMYAASGEAGGRFAQIAQSPPPGMADIVAGIKRAYLPLLQTRQANRSYDILADVQRTVELLKENRHLAKQLGTIQDSADGTATARRREVLQSGIDTYLRSVDYAEKGAPTHLQGWLMRAFGSMTSEKQVSGFLMRYNKELAETPPAANMFTGVPDSRSIYLDKALSRELREQTERQGSFLGPAEPVEDLPATAVAAEAKDLEVQALRMPPAEGTGLRGPGAGSRTASPIDASSFKPEVEKVRLQDHYTRIKQMVHQEQNPAAALWSLDLLPAVRERLSMMAGRKIYQDAEHGLRMFYEDATDLLKATEAAIAKRFETPTPDYDPNTVRAFYGGVGGLKTIAGQGERSLSVPGAIQREMSQRQWLESVPPRGDIIERLDQIVADEAMPDAFERMGDGSYRMRGSHELAEQGPVDAATSASRAIPRQFRILQGSDELFDVLSDPRATFPDKRSVMQAQFPDMQRALADVAAQRQGMGANALDEALAGVMRDAGVAPDAPSLWLNRMDILPEPVRELLGEHEPMFRKAMERGAKAVETVRSAGGRAGESITDLIERSTDPKIAKRLGELRDIYGEDLASMDEFDIMRSEVILHAFKTHDVKSTGEALKLINQSLDIWKAHTLLSASYPLVNVTSAVGMATLQGVNPIITLRNLYKGLRVLLGPKENRHVRRAVQDIGGAFMRGDISPRQRRQMLGSGVRNLGKWGEGVPESFIPAAAQEYYDSIGAVAPNFQGIMRRGADSISGTTDDAQHAIESMGLGKHIALATGYGFVGSGLNPAGAAVGAAYGIASFYGIRGVISVNRVVEDVVRHTIVYDRSRDFMKNNLPRFIAEQREASGDVVADAFQAIVKDGWQKTAEQMAEEAVEQGVTSSEAIRLAERWATLADESVRVGERRAYDSQVNYAKRKVWEEWTATRYLLPFLKWPKEAMPFFIKSMLSHPLFLRATGDILEAGKQGWEEQVSPSWHKYLRDPTGIFANFLGTERAGINVLRVINPYAAEVSDIDRDDHLFKQVIDATGIRFGGPLQPVTAVAMGMAGLDPPPMNDVGRWTSFLRDATGVDVEQAPREALRTASRQLTGGAPNTWDEWNLFKITKRLSGEQATAEGYTDREWGYRRDKLYDSALRATQGDEIDDPLANDIAVRATQEKRQRGFRSTLLNSTLPVTVRGGFAPDTRDKEVGAYAPTWGDPVKIQNYAASRDKQRFKNPLGVMSDMRDREYRHVMRERAEEQGVEVAEIDTPQAAAARAEPKSGRDIATNTEAAQAVLANEPGYDALVEYWASDFEKLVPQEHMDWIADLYEQFGYHDDGRKMQPEFFVKHGLRRMIQ